MMETGKDRLPSFWETVAIPGMPRLAADTAVDVCVVGGGVAGLLAAYHCAKRGHAVALVEAFQLGSGQSGRTTAHLSFQLDDLYSELVKQHDLEQVSLFAHGHRRAIDLLEELVVNENIRCDFARRDGYLFLGPGDTRHVLEEEVAVGLAMGLSLEFVENVPGLANLGPAVRFHRQAQLHPLKLIAGLAQVLKDMGVKLFEHTPARDFQVDPAGATVVAENGSRVRAKYVVVTTDTPVNNRFYIHTKQTAHRTYVVGFKLPEGHKLPLLWDTYEPYHYVRQAGSMLLVGGEDHRTGVEADNDPFLRLKDWAREKFPFVGEVEWQWSGQVYEPVDRFAFAGRNPGAKNVFITTGLSGSGYTGAALAASIRGDLIDGKGNPWEKLLDPSRLLVKNALHYLKDNFATAYQYKDWMTPAEVSDETQIPDDCGGLLREGATKTCVYHAAGDAFEKKSAVCTHLGGIVHWNDVEKTWDCPCHGSRFNAHGKVIEGPALGDLTER